MHISGKIFAVLTMLLSVAAIVLAAKTLDRQNEWNQRVATARQNYEQEISQLPDAENKVLSLESELKLARLDWGRQWSNVQVTPRNLQLGQLTIGLGQTVLARRTDEGDKFPLLQGFQQQPDGSMKYVGEFRVTQVDATQAAIQLARTPRDGETANWNTNQPWRFRDSFPAGKRAQIGELLLELTLIEQRLKDRQLNLTIQQKSVQAAQSLLDQRLNELNGNPGLGEEISDDFRLGLVQTLKNAETARDVALAEVQKLRVELRDLHTQFEQILANNQKLEKQLSAGTSAAEEPSVSAGLDKSTN